VLVAFSVFVFLGFLGFVSARGWKVSPAPFFVVALSLIVVGVSTQLSISPFYLGLGDGGQYLDWATAISEAWREGQPWNDRAIWPGKGLWVLLIAVMNFFFGPVLISLIVINAAVFSFSLILLQKTMGLLFGVRPKWTIIVLTLTSSPVLLFTPTLLREAFFWFGITAGILAIAYFYRTSYVAGLAFLLLSVLVVIGIRPNLGVLIAYPLVAVVIAMWAVRKGSVSISRILIGSSLIAVLGVTFFPAVSALATADVVETVTVVSRSLANSGDPTTGLQQDKSGGPSNVVSRSLANSGDPTTGLQQDKSGGPSNFCNSTSYVGILCNSLARLPAFIFGPFLWEIGPEPIWIVVIASSLHFLFLLATSVLFLFQKKQRNLATLGLFALALITLLILAAVLTNYGIIIRFRVVVELFLFPLTLGFLLQRRDGISPPKREWQLPRFARKAQDTTTQRIEGFKPASRGR